MRWNLNTLVIFFYTVSLIVFLAATNTISNPLILILNGLQISVFGLFDIYSNFFTNTFNWGTEIVQTFQNSVFWANLLIGNLVSKVLWLKTIILAHFSSYTTFYILIAYYTITISIIYFLINYTNVIFTIFNKLVSTKNSPLIVLIFTLFR
jgi:hypothetical protein